MMTFEEFQATGTLKDALPCWADYFDTIEESPQAMVYHGDLYIEKHPQGWYLLLERSDWITTDLADLERKLYEFGISGGFFE